MGRRVDVKQSASKEELDEERWCSPRVQPSEADQRIFADESPSNDRQQISEVESIRA